MDILGALVTSWLACDQGLDVAVDASHRDHDAEMSYAAAMAVQRPWSIAVGIHKDTLYAQKQKPATCACVASKAHNLYREGGACRLGGASPHLTQPLHPATSD
jgi:hypothetical protein